MSIDLDIQLSEAELDVVAVCAETEQVLLRMLNLSHPLSLTVRQSTDQGQTGSLATRILDVDSNSSVNLSLEDQGQIILMVFPALDDGQDAPRASVSPFGEGCVQGGLVLAIACAIGIARLQSSVIGNSTAMFRKEFFHEPQELFEWLRCWETHDDLQVAIAEVLGQIEALEVQTSSKRRWRRQARKQAATAESLEPIEAQTSPSPPDIEN